MVDGLGPFYLPSRLGDLFEALAAEGGTTVHDRLVGFKILSDVGAYIRAKKDGGKEVGRSLTDRAFAQGLSRLRAEMKAWFAGAPDLVQNNRAGGWRVAVRRSRK